MKGYLFVFTQLLCLITLLFTGPLFASRVPLLCLEIGAFALAGWAIWVVKPANVRATPHVPPSAVLVTDGPYKYVRHPMYTALMLATFAVVLDDLTIGRLAVWVALVVDLLAKLRYEEKQLGQHFEGYGPYSRRTKRLIPGIY